MVSTDIPNSENQFDFVKGIRYGSNCQKSYSTDVAEHKKLIYTKKLFGEEQFGLTEFRLQFQSFFCPKRQDNSVATKRQRRIQVEKVYKRTPPYLTYIGDSIDQGATRLGGL